MIKRYKLRRGCLYYIKEMDFHSRWQETVYKWKLNLRGWKLEEIREEY